jgi:AraC family transcriptional regulator
VSNVKLTSVTVSSIEPTAITLPSSHQQLTATLWRCGAGPQDRPRTEQHVQHSLSYVLRGSFGCRCRGRHCELARGALFVGHAGDEYLCTHEHHGGGDECLSFTFDAELVDQIGGDARAWLCVAMPPHPALMALGELARATAAGHTALALDELGMALGSRLVALHRGATAPARQPSARERRRAMQAAEWIDAHSTGAVDLDSAAAQIGSSRYHFLRLFARVVGVTPHQYLIRCRLRRAARLLAEDTRPITQVALDCGFADLSNFVRSFGRATGHSPLAFRRLAQGQQVRKILQAGDAGIAEDAGSIHPGAMSCSITSESRWPISRPARPSTPPH